MKLRVERNPPSNNAITGRLFIDDLFFCHTLEPAEFLYPEGTYPLVIQYSPRFKRKTPRIQGTNILIHPGNTVKDTMGCILVGALGFQEPPYIFSSRLTYNQLMTELKKSDTPHSITLTTTL